MISAPLATILPSFIPILIERGVPGYEKSSSLIPGEKRLTEIQVRSLLTAAAYFGALDYVGQRLDGNQVQTILDQSVKNVSVLSSEEIKTVLDLIERFYGFGVIRENHAFDDWLSEAWWSWAQTVPYRYPSAMSEAVTYGLTIRQSLDRCSLEY